MGENQNCTIFLAQVQELKNLLNDMTKADPDTRPSAMVANQRMNGIFEAIHLFQMTIPIVDISL